MRQAVSLRIRHRTRFRSRLRLETPIDDVDIKRLADELASVAGVTRAVVRPNTASVILETGIPLDEVLTGIEERGIARVRDANRPPPIKQTLQFGILQADMAVKRRSQDAFDLRGAIATLLIVMAVVQMTRGRIAGPATTLLMSALSMLDFNALLERRS
jgi:hypothetical protein